MRILILANNDVGLYQFRKDLIYELLKQNEVYISLPYGDLVDPLVEAGCTFINTRVDSRGTNPITDLSLYIRYKKIISDVQPDLIITYTIKPNIYGGYAASRKRVNYVVNITGLGTAFENRGIVHFIAKTLYKVSIKKAKVVFFENSANRDLFINEGIILKEQAYLLNGAGVNTDHFCYEEYPNNEEFQFLFIGRIMKEKGIEELLEATQSLISDGKKCLLNVVGPYEDDYKDILEKCENEGWLKYFGFQSDVRPFIKKCDCFVLPSYHEGMANTNLESASTGRPVIASNIPGCKEAVIDGISGLLCKVKNTDSLKSSMQKILNLSVEERAAMGKAGRKHIEKYFDKKQVVAETIKVILKKTSKG